MREDRDAASISVVIPCHNYARFLPDAIESVLEQSYHRFELIVVDDGSSDDTTEVVGRYPTVRYFRTGGSGLSAARNRGLRESLGEYVVFLDADDRLLPTALQAGLNALTAHSECPMVFGLCRYMAPPGSRLPAAQSYVPNVNYVDLLTKNYIPNPGCVMYRREVFHTIGAFNEKLSPAADFELYLRIARTFPTFAHPEEVVEYRIHDDSMSNDGALMLDAIMRVFKAERVYVKGKAEYETACERGRRQFLDYYYYPLLRELKSRICAHQWRMAISTLAVLFHYYPREVLGSIGRTLHHAATRLRRIAGTPSQRF